MESYRKGLDLEEMRSAIKMIERMVRERVEKSGKHEGMGGKERIRGEGGVAAYSRLFHHLDPIYWNFSKSTSYLSLTVK